jgi:putative peptidoglycan lipid II flippase
MGIFATLRRLIAQTFNVAGESRQIARGMLLVAVFALVAKLAAAAKEIAIAGRFGISEVVDAYLFVLNLAGLPVTLWFTLLTVVYIPLEARLRVESPEALVGFRRELFGSTLWLGMAFGVISWLALAAYFNSPMSGLTPSVRALALHISPWLAMTVPLGIVTHYGSVQVMSGGKHVNTLLEGVPAVVLLAVVLAIPSSEVAPLVVGTVLGAVCHLGFVALAVVKGGRWHWPLFTLTSPTWKLFWAGMGVMLVGQIAQTLTTIIDQLYAARLGAGAIATIGYANRLLSLALTLVATAVARASLPVFSKMHAGKEQSLWRVASRWGHLMFFTGLAIVLIGLLGAEPLVSLLFERGAFTSADTKAVSEVFRYGLVQMPFYMASLIVVYALLSGGKFKPVATIGVVNLIVKIGAAQLLIPNFGLNGLMLSTAVMYFVSWLLAWRFARQ